MHIWILSTIIELIKFVQGQQYSIQAIDPGSEKKLPCPLETPSILSDGTHVDLSITDIHVQNASLIVDGFQMRVGYAEIFQNFVFKGCTNPTMSPSYRLDTRNLGRCFTMCKKVSGKPYFGIGGYNCYCMDSLDGRFPCGNCEAACECDRPRGTPCGGSNSKIATYEQGNDEPGENENDVNNLCRAVNTSRKNTTWRKCTEQNSFICHTGTKYKYEKDTVAWRKSVDECLEGKNYPTSDRINFTELSGRFISRGIIWTGGLRGKTISTLNNDGTIPGYQGGHLVYKNKRFKLEFGGQLKSIKYALCDGQNTEKVTTTTSDKDNPSNDSEEYLEAVYIIIPVLLVIISIIILALIAKRRNISIVKVTNSKSTDSKTNLTGTSNVAFRDDGDVELHDYHVLEPGSEYMTIHDSDLDRNKEDPYNHTNDEHKISSDNVYNKLESSHCVYNQLNETLANDTTTYNKCNDTQTGAYNTINEATALKTGEYNTFNEASAYKTGMYNTLNEAKSVSSTGVYSHNASHNSAINSDNETTPSNTEAYSTLKCTASSKHSKGDIEDVAHSIEETYETLNKTNSSCAYETINKNHNNDDETNDKSKKENTEDAGALFTFNEINAPKTSEYFILVKQ